jgi:hypothetical protein
MRAPFSAFAPIDLISAKRGMEEMLLEATSILYFLIFYDCNKNMACALACQVRGTPGAI